MTTNNKTSKPHTLADFESTIKQITEITTQLEQNNLPLEQALQQFEQGTALINQCQQTLNKAEQQIQILQKQQLEPFNKDE